MAVQAASAPSSASKMAPTRAALAPVPRQTTGRDLQGLNPKPSTVRTGLMFGSGSGGEWPCCCSLFVHAKCAAEHSDQSVMTSSAVAS